MMVVFFISPSRVTFFMCSPLFLKNDLDPCPCCLPSAHMDTGLLFASQQGTCEISQLPGLFVVFLHINGAFHHLEVLIVIKLQ